MQWTRRVMGLAVVGVLAVAAGLGALNLPIGAPGPFDSDSPSVVAGSPAPPFALTTPDGRRKTLASWVDRPLVLAFLPDRGTPEDSPTLAVLRAAEDRLKGTRVAFVGINTNLLNVSQKAARAFLARGPVPPGLVFLTGSRLALAAVWQAYGVNVAIIGGRVAFTPAVYVIQPNGYEETAFLVDQSGRNLTGEIRRLVSAVQASR